MNFKELLKTAERATISNSPGILTALAVTGTLTTAYFSGRAGFRVGLDVNAAHYEAGDDRALIDSKFLFQTYWKEFIPAASATALAVAAAIAANKIGSGRTAAVATAFMTTERAFSEYRDRVVQTMGDKPERAMRNELSAERIAKTPGYNLIVVSGNESVCYDEYSGRYFRSTYEAIMKAQNEINYQINNFFYASLSDFYNKIGVPTTDSSDIVGWNADKQLEIRIDAIMSPESKPVLSIDFSVQPIHDYHRVN